MINPDFLVNFTDITSSTKTNKIHNKSTNNYLQALHLIVCSKKVPKMINVYIDKMMPIKERMLTYIKKVRPLSVYTHLAFLHCISLAVEC